MIVEQRIYRIRNGKLAEFLDFVEKESLPVQLPVLGNLIGYFHTEVGELSQVVHLWGYESFEDRMTRRGELAKSDEWKTLLPRLADYIVQAENRILIPARFSPIR